MRPAWLIVLACALALALGGCGAGGAAQPAPPAGPAAQAPTGLRARLLGWHLPAPVAGESVLALSGRLLVIGGLDAGGASSDAILAIDPTSGSLRGEGRLAQPTHDAAAAMLHGRTLLFGGGESASYSGVEELRADLVGSVVGSLPAPRSDLAAVSARGRAYLLGGYDGTTLSGDVLATSDGRRFARVAGLAIPVRYPAVAASGGAILVFGGERSSGAPTDAIQRIDPRRGTSKVIGSLPKAGDHAAAVTVGGGLFIVGGNVAGTPSRQIFAFDPRSDRVSRAGAMPTPVADAAATAIGGRAYLVGGLGAGGLATDRVIELTPAR